MVTLHELLSVHNSHRHGHESEGFHVFWQVPRCKPIKCNKLTSFIMLYCNATAIIIIIIIKEYS